MLTLIQNAMQSPGYKKACEEYDEAWTELTKIFADLDAACDAALAGFDAKEEETTEEGQQDKESLAPKANEEKNLIVAPSDNEVIAARNDVLAELLKDGVITKLPDEVTNETQSCDEAAADLRMLAKSGEIPAIKDAVRKKYTPIKREEAIATSSSLQEPLITHFEFKNTTPIIMVDPDEQNPTIPKIMPNQVKDDSNCAESSHRDSSEYGHLVFGENINDGTKHLLEASFTALIAMPEARCKELEINTSNKYPGLLEASYTSTDGNKITRILDPGVLISANLVTIQVPVGFDNMMLPVPGQWNYVLNAFLYSDFKLDSHEAMHIASHFMFGDQSLYGYFDMSKYNTRNLPESKFRNLELKLHRIMDFIPTVADSGKMLPRWRFAKVSHGGDNFTLVSDKGVISPFASTGETSPTILKGATIIVDGDSIILKYKGKDYKVPVFESIEDVG